MLAGASQGIGQALGSPRHQKGRMQVPPVRKSTPDRSRSDCTSMPPRLVRRRARGSGAPGGSRWECVVLLRQEGGVASEFDGHGEVGEQQQAAPARTACAAAAECDGFSATGQGLASGTPGATIRVLTIRYRI